jgi:hypothetical protein
MKRIIALWHSGNKGKTNTLIELGNLLLSENTVDIVYCDKSVNKNGILPQKQDFTLVVKLFDKTVGIVSQGDPHCKLKDRLQKIIDDYNVDYLFCATRTKGETIDDVYRISGSNAYEILWTSTYHSDNGNMTDFFNNLKAKHLLDMLKELISQKKCNKNNQ